MGLSPVTCAVLKRGRLGGISEMPLLSLRGLSVSGMYVCIVNKYIASSVYQSILTSHNITVNSKSIAKILLKHGKLSKGEELTKL
jgi:hypothetical protein